MKLHPQSSSKAVDAICVETKRRDEETIALHYAVEGDMSRVAIPTRAAQSKHVDELWRRTCFEAFLREPAGPGYVEFNFSPSTEYAGYGFTRYREGMRAAFCSRPDVSVTTAPDRLDLFATIRLSRTQLNLKGPLRLGLSAIIEETDGTKSYWALAHPQGKPDFHHVDSFVLDLWPERT